MKKQKYSPLKSKLPQHELMNKLTDDLNLQNRLKLAEIGKYRRFIKNNNLIELVYKFSGKKHHIDRDILYSDLLKEKYKDLQEEVKQEENQISEPSFVLLKGTAATGFGTLTSKKETMASYNPFKITNETIELPTEGKKNELKESRDNFHKQSKHNTGNIKITKECQDGLPQVIQQKLRIKSKNNSSYSFFAQNLKKKLAHADSLDSEKEVKISGADRTNSTFCKTKNRFTTSSLNHEIERHKSREHTIMTEKPMIKTRMDLNKFLHEKNKSQIKSVSIKEFVKLNKISDNIQTALKTAKLELQNTQFFDKRNPLSKLDFKNLFKRNVNVMD